MRYLVSVLAIASMSMGSCKKSYTCVCKTVDPGISIKTERNSMRDWSRERAASTCKEGNKTFGRAVTQCGLD